MKELVIHSTICLTLETKNKQQLTSVDWTLILIQNKLFLSLETKAIYIQRNRGGTGKQGAAASSSPLCCPSIHSSTNLLLCALLCLLNADLSAFSILILAPPLAESRRKLTACAHKMHGILSSATWIVSSFFPRHISPQVTYFFKSS